MSAPVETDQPSELFANLQQADPTLHCANCNTVYAAGQHFCGQCSQKIPTHRMSVHDIAHDTMHAIFHVDRSILSLVSALAIRPGHVARDYIAGHRKRYFGPFGFLAIVVAISSLALASSGFMDAASGDVRISHAMSFLERHVNLVILLQVPVLAAISMLLFPRSKFYFAEHMVVAAYASGMRSFFLTLIVLPGWYVVRQFVPGQWIIPVYILLWAVYYGFAAGQFNRVPQSHRGWLWFKGALAALVTQLITMIVITIPIVIYTRILKD